MKRFPIGLRLFMPIWMLSTLPGCTDQNTKSKAQPGDVKAAVPTTDAAKAPADVGKRAGGQEPSDFARFFSRGHDLFAVGECRKAIPNYSEAIRLAPDNPHLWLVYESRAECWWELKDYKKAIADYDEVIRRRPDHTPALQNRGIVWSSVGDLDKAISDYSTIIRIKPSAGVYHNRGTVWYRKKEYQKAIDDLTESVRSGIRDTPIR